MTQSVNFKFATDILRRLGEELNPSPDQGILELVRNAYDADAIQCIIELDPSNTGEIRISDDGDGMDASTITNAWLLIGRSSKNKKKETRLGRTPVGNKGLGRLAALRMGDRVSLITRPFTEPRQEYQLSIDWRIFDQADSVEEVKLVINSEIRESEEKKGTILLLSDLHKPLNQGEIRKLARGLLLLADPFGDNPIGFQPILVSPQFVELENIVKQRYFQEAEYNLTAEVDSNGFATATVFDYRGNILYTATHSQIRSDRVDQPYLCPPAKFDLWNFLLSGAHFSTRKSSLAEVKEWLDTFGGVHLYIRGLRVSPYGDPGNDWLDMNRLRASDPQERPSTNNSIGRILIDDDDRLPQKTDRSGIVENSSFFAIREFAVDAIKWMSRRRISERDRVTRAEKKAVSEKRKSAKEDIAKWFHDFPDEMKKEANRSLEQYDRLRDKEAQILQKETQLYRLLGTTGITSAVFAHETKNSVVLISRNARAIRRRLKKYFEIEPPNDLEECIDIILDQAGALNAFGGLTLSFINREKRRLSRINLYSVIRKVITLFQPLLRDGGIRIVVNLESGNPFLRSTEAAIESIIANLLVNGIKAVTQSEVGERLIEFNSSLIDNRVVLRVLDNADGIKGIDVQDVWLPGETTYEDGTGLGLTIVRDTVLELGGEVKAIANGSRGGAEFIITFPILGV